MGYLAILKKLSELGAEEIHGHLLFAVSEIEYQAAFAWLERAGLIPAIQMTAQALRNATPPEMEAALDKMDTLYMEAWQAEAKLKTFGGAVADAMQARVDDGERFDMTIEEWHEFAKRASFYEVREQARAMGIHQVWDCELPKTPEGFYQVQGGLDYAIAKSLAAAPVCRLAVDGDQDRRSGGRGKIRTCDPCTISRQDAGLQFVAVVQLGHDWDVRGTDATIPGGTGQVRLRLQLHHLWRASDRWFGRGGIRNRAQAGRHVGFGAPAAQVPSAGVAVSHPADAGRRASPGWRADGIIRTHGCDQGDGQGIDAVPASGANGSSTAAARRVAGGLG